MSRKAKDLEAIKAQRENLEAIIRVHKEFLAKIPGLGYDEEVEDRMIRAGEKYVAELEKDLRSIA